MLVASPLSGLSLSSLGLDTFKSTGVSLRQTFTTCSQTVQRKKEGKREREREREREKREEREKRGRRERGGGRRPEVVKSPAAHSAMKVCECFLTLGTCAGSRGNLWTICATKSLGVMADKSHFNTCNIVDSMS